MSTNILFIKYAYIFILILIFTLSNNIIPGPIERAVAQGLVKNVLRNFWRRRFRTLVK